MSIEAQAWALDARRTGAMSPEHRLVLAILADYANAEHDHQAWPKVATLAARIATTPRSIHRAIAALSEQGHITPGDPELVAHLPADKRPRVWRLSVNRPARGDSSVTPPPDSSVTPRGDSTVSHGVTALSPRTNNRTPIQNPHPQTPAPDELEACTTCGDVDADHDPATCPGAAPPARPPIERHQSRAYIAAVDAAKLRHRLRRPDGSCRECDDVHSIGTPCKAPAPPPPDWRTAPPPETATPHDQPLPLT